MRRYPPLRAYGIITLFSLLFVGLIAIDLHAQATGAISGTVTDEADNPLANIVVQAASLDPENNTLWNSAGQTQTDDNGRYTVTTATTTTIDVILAAAATITGTLTDSSGNPAAGVTVRLYVFDAAFGWTPTVESNSDSQGNYLLEGIAGGTYRLEFVDEGTDRIYSSEFYNDAVNVDTADDISVSEGGIVRNINAQLARLSQLQGIVTDETGAPLPAILAVALRYTPIGGGNYYWQEVGSNQTDETGQYSIGSLDPGAYHLTFFDFNSNYHAEWYNNQGYEIAATALQLAAETTLSGINVQLAAEPFTWPPFAQNDTMSVSEGATANTLADDVTSLLANDLSEFGNPLQATAAVLPAHGTLTLNAGGTFSYTHDGSETTSDHFTYRATDGIKQSNITTVTIAIQPVNDPPVANDDTLVVARGQTATTLTSGADSVLANDSDADDATLTATVLTMPQHGTLTLNSNGTFVYIHNSDSAAVDSFTYRALDKLAAADSATVAITINHVSEPKPSLTFSKTVGIAGILPLCSSANDMKAPVATTIVYCYTVRNTGNVTLNTHSLVDSHLGQLLTNVTHVLAPGATYATTFTQTLTITTTNVATWTAIAAANAATVSAPLATTAKEAATVRISGPTDDADHDSIPDNLEKATDTDGDNIPNFLDTDADGDGVSDDDEVGADPNAPLDSDKDGIPDYLDTDSQPPTNYLQLLPLIRH